MTALLQVVAPSSEPVSVSEALTHCRIDCSNQEPAPSAITVALASPAASGNVTEGDHRVLATFVTPDGETEAGIVSASVTVADAGVNGQLSLSNIPVGGSTVSARNIYMTEAGGSTFLYAQTISNNTDTTATVNIADGSLGVGAPTANSTLDPEISALIKAARAMAESITRRVFVSQTWDFSLDRFPCWDLYIPLSPVQEISSISYIDENGDTQTLDPSLYKVDTASMPARITPAFGQVWPSTRWENNAVTIRFVAGYGAASAVPDGIKSWMLLRIKHYMDNKGPVVTGTIVSPFPRSFVDGLLDEFVCPSFSWVNQ